MILDKLPHYSDRATEAMSLSVSTQCKPKTSPPLGMGCIWEFAKIRSTFWGPHIKDFGVYMGFWETTI